MNSIIITTTNNLEGYKVVSYYSPVSANIVIGANIFSDISASFTDFFGGRSGTYENKLQEMYENILERLREQAMVLGANSILGLKVDFGEISGKGTQMFMLSAVGTPVFAERENKNLEDDNHSNRPLKGELIETKVRANNIIKAFYNGAENLERLSDGSIDFILKTRLIDFSPLVLAVIASSKSHQAEEYEIRMKKIASYFGFINKNEAISHIYPMLLNGSFGNRGHVIVHQLIQEFDLIDYNKVLELLKSSELSVRKDGLRILNYNKSNYSVTDISLMEEFVEIIKDSFPLLAERTLKKGILTSGKEAWLCTCGKTNEMTEAYCENCNEDPFGFYESEAKPKDVLLLIEDRLKVIEELRMKDSSDISV